MPSAAVLVLLAVLLAGCASSADPSADPSGEGSGTSGVAGSQSLSVTLVRYRSDIEPRRVQVRVEQGAGPAVRLRGVEVEVPGFAGTSRRDLDTASRPGAALDLPVPLGAVSCPAAGGPPPEDGPATVRLVVGEGRDVLELEAQDPKDVMPRLREAECRERALLAVVDLAWGPTWTRRQVPGEGARGLALDGTLRVGPVAAGSSVDLAGLDATVLLRPTAAVPLPLRVGAEGTGGPGTPVEVPVTMTPVRCDAHAVGEAKRGYAFGVRVAVDGQEPVSVAVEPEPHVRAVLEGALLDACGLR